LDSRAEVKVQIVGGAERARSETGLRRKAAALASVIAVIALVVGALFGDRGILQLLEQRERARELGEEIDRMRAENARLLDEIRALKSDPRAIERLAREELGLAGPGETVFLIREDPPARP
jgi:cell division protein FtsB